MEKRYINYILESLSKGVIPDTAKYISDEALNFYFKDNLAIFNKFIEALKGFSNRYSIRTEAYKYVANQFFLKVRSTSINIRIFDLECGNGAGGFFLSQILSLMNDKGIPNNIKVYFVDASKNVINNITRPFVIFANSFYNSNISFDYYISFSSQFLDSFEYRKQISSIYLWERQLGTCENPPEKINSIFDAISRNAFLVIGYYELIDKKTVLDKYSSKRSKYFIAKSLQYIGGIINNPILQNLTSSDIYCEWDNITKGSSIGGPVIKAKTTGLEILGNKISELNCHHSSRFTKDDLALMFNRTGKHNFYRLKFINSKKTDLSYAVFIPKQDIK